MRPLSLIYIISLLLLTACYSGTSHTHGDGDTLPHPKALPQPYPQGEGDEVTSPSEANLTQLPNYPNTRGGTPNPITPLPQTPKNDQPYNPITPQPYNPIPARLYSVGFNFIVVADSLLLQAEEPLLAVETVTPIAVHRGDGLVVVMHETLTADSTDTVWVRVARDQYTMGWVREAELLEAVAPHDPISMFIYTFSNEHLIYFLSVVALAGLLVLARWRKKKRTRMVHWDDIPSPYPTLLCVCMATAAVLYASIQHFAPMLWQRFYFAPTLNPFSLNALLSSSAHEYGLVHALPCAFISILWIELLLAIATLDDVLRLLSPSQAAMYLLTTLALCMGIYTIFSLAPLVWVAIPGLIIYAVWALLRYWRHSRPTCLCGYCGKPMHTTGTCPWCGAINTL